MKKLFTFAFFALLFGLFASSNISGQTVGKIFTKEEADAQFGKVIESVAISPAEFKSIISKTIKYVSFRVSSGRASILGDKRTAIYPSLDAVVGKLDVHHLYSKSMVTELLNKGTGDMVYLENRKDVSSITYGTYTLEMSILCPPFCPGSE